MSLLLSRLGFSHNHHNSSRHPNHNMSEASLASLQAYRSLVSKTLMRLLESLKLGSDFLTLAWMHECLKILPMINNAFAKLMMEIEYPVTSWELCSIDEYLDYTIKLLELLNYISSSISHVNHSRTSLMHALSLMERSPDIAIERMKEIKKQDSMKDYKGIIGGDEDVNGSGKQCIFHEAMMVMKSIGFWVCGVVLVGLKSGVGPNIEIVRRGVFVDSSMIALDSIFKKFRDERGMVKEVEEVNECVRMIVSSGIGDSSDGMELKRRLEVAGNGLKGIKEEEEGLFRSVMAARNEVLEMLRRNNH